MLRFAPSAALRFVSLAAMLALAACKGDEKVSVELRVLSDLVPVVEVGTVSVSLFDGPANATDVARGAVERSIASGTPLARGIWLATFDDLPVGTYTVWTTLRRDNGETIGKRPLTFTVARDVSYTVVLTADCSGVECPNAGGNAAFLACLAGECVPSECAPETPEACPEGLDLFCDSDADCEPLTACGTASCVSRVCVQQPLSSECAAGEHCSAISGCTADERPQSAPVDEPGLCGDACALADAPCEYAFVFCTGGASECRSVAFRPAGAPCPNGGLCDADGQCEAGVRPDAGVDDGGVPADGDVLVDGGAADMGDACVDCGPLRIERITAARTPIEGDQSSYLGEFSPDGDRIAFVSYAENLVGDDSNGYVDVFVKSVRTGALERVSVSADGTEGDDNSWSPRFSPDGTKVMFESDASNLVEGDVNGVRDIFIKDLVSGEIEIVSRSFAGALADNWSESARFSPDGSRVVFRSSATNFVPGDRNGKFDIFVKNLVTGAVQRVSTSDAGGEVNGDSFDPIFSPDGESVAFSSEAANLVAGDTNGQSDVFLKYVAFGSISRVSVRADGAQATGGGSFQPAFSPDGLKIAFSSVASNLAVGDTNGGRDVFVKELDTQHVMLVSIGLGEVSADGESQTPAFSPDGASVGFVSFASNLVVGDSNGREDIFVTNLATENTSRWSVSASGDEGFGGSYFPCFSPEGTRLAFASSADLVDGDSNESDDVFVKVFETGAVTRVSVAERIVEANGASGEASFSSDGRLVVFSSDASNLVPGDANGTKDVFVKDLETGEIRLLSKGRLGLPANGPSFRPSFSNDASMVVFASFATNLVASDGNDTADIFIAVVATGAVFRVSEDDVGNESNGPSDNPFFSPDGLNVAFTSSASNLVLDDGNGSDDVLVKNLDTGEIRRISSTEVGTAANGSSSASGFSTDGSMLLFESTATNLVEGDTNSVGDVFARRLTSNETVRVSVSREGAQGSSASYGARFIGDSWDVVFSSDAPNLVTGDTNAVTDVFVANVGMPLTTRVSVGADGAQANGQSYGGDAASSRPLVAFTSRATHLVAGDTNGRLDVFVKNLTTGTVRRASVSESLAEADGDSSEPRFAPDGANLLIRSTATNLVPGDTNAAADIFVVTLP